MSSQSLFLTETDFWKWAIPHLPLRSTVQGKITKYRIGVMTDHWDGKEVSVPVLSQLAPGTIAAWRDVRRIPAGELPLKSASQEKGE